MQPWCYDQPLRYLQRAAAEIGIENLGLHSLRHTYRAWMSSVGTSMDVQRKMMRHSSILTTMNVYGDVVTNEMEQVQGKVAGLALQGAKHVA
jgi:integrase